MSGYEGGIKKLAFLLEMLEKFEQGEKVDFNQPREITYQARSYDHERNIYINHTKTKNFSCIKIAAIYCEQEVLAFLFQHGAKPIPGLLQRATMYRHEDNLEDRVRVLKEGGVDLDAPEKNGHTPLYNASIVDAGYGRPVLAKALRDNGAKMGFFEPVQVAAHNAGDLAKRVAGVIIMPFPK